MTDGILFPSGFYSLSLTLLCGQCFRWYGPDPEGWFTGVAGQAFWKLRQEGDSIRWECNSATVRGERPGVWLSQYLGLADDPEEWTRSFEDHPVMQNPLKSLKGLRLIHQEPWECTVSYMFAQGLSVKVIRHAIQQFCTAYGKPLEGVKGHHAFPEAGNIARLSPEVLRPFTNNYLARADRIIRIARTVEAQVISLEILKKIPCDEARETLMALEGIGPKIADCILLFSMDQKAAFPVDRWVLRAMRRHFRSVKLLGGALEAPTRTQYLKIVQKARIAFGSNCGLASEYLFLYLRLLDDEKFLQEMIPFLSPGTPLFILGEKAGLRVGPEKKHVKSVRKPL